MKIKDIKELLKHYQDKEYEDWEIVLWDYNNQRKIEWNGGTFASSKPDKEICFSVTMEPVDGKTIDQRVKELYSRLYAVSDKDMKEKIKQLLRDNGYYAGNTKIANILYNLAGEYDD